MYVCMYVCINMTYKYMFPTNELGEYDLCMFIMKFPTNELGEHDLCMFIMKFPNNELCEHDLCTYVHNEVP